jgi:hypothetical protein
MAAGRCGGFWSTLPKVSRGCPARTFGAPDVEFVDYGEAIQLLEEQGIREVAEAEDRIGLTLEGGPEVVHLHLTCGQSAATPHDGADVVTVEKSRLASAVDHILHKLHLAQVLLIPVAKWRKVFDAVAFSMAENEDWQAVDATATLALNTRDPLLCEPADFHTIIALITALLNDAESPDQGLMLTTTAAPVMMEIVPDGAIRISIGNPVLADEVVEAFGSAR